MLTLEKMFSLLLGLILLHSCNSHDHQCNCSEGHKNLEAAMCNTQAAVPLYFVPMSNHDFKYNKVLNKRSNGTDELLQKVMQMDMLSALAYNGFQIQGEKSTIDFEGYMRKLGSFVQHQTRALESAANLNDGLVGAVHFTVSLFKEIDSKFSGIEVPQEIKEELAAGLQSMIKRSFP